MMQAGIFTGYFPYGLDETAKKIRGLGFNTVQLDLHFKDVDLSAGQITKDKARNGALHRRITTFITTTRRNRQTGGMVTEQVKTTKADRDIAALIASQGVGAEDLAEALRLLAEKREDTK